MKALRIAFFACVLSVFFCFTAYADNSVTLAIPYLSSVTVTEQFNTTVSTGGQEFTAGDLVFVDVSNTFSAFTVINYNGVNVGGANIDYTADFIVESVSAGAGVSVTRSGNRFYLKSEYTNFGTSGIPVTVVYSVSAKWNRGVVPTTSNPIENCYLRTTCNVNVSAATKTQDDMPNEWGNRNQLITINSKVNDILELLDGLDNTPPTDFLGDDALFYFDERYFNSLFVPNGNGVLLENGYWTVNYSNSGKMLLDFFNENKDGSGGRPVSGLLEPGTYYGVISIPAQMSLENIAFEHISASYYDVEIFPYNDANGYRFIPFVIDVKQHIAFNGIIFNFGVPAAPLQNAIIYGGIAPVNPDYLAGESLNPDQEINRDELENQGEQQSQQEQQLWHNVNTYKSQLDFGLNSWSDAADGLNYVTDVFLLIWNNSPTQIITLSLMLGIGMLAIGRGVMAARRQAKDDT